jgi:hypothetical protein
MMFKYLMSIGLIILVSLSSHAVALVSAGKIIAADGKVSAINVDKEVRPIKRGDDFYMMDTIQTDDASTVSLRFTDGTLLELKEKSAFEIKDYHFKQDEAQNDSYSAQLIKGGFRTITGALGKRNPDHYAVQAQMTTLTIRGTEYVININANDVQVGLISGAASVSSCGNNMTASGATGVAALCGKKVDLVANSNAVIHRDGTIVRAPGVPSSMMNGYSSNNINTLKTQAVNAGFTSGPSQNNNSGGQTVFIQGEGNASPPPPVNASSPCAGVAGMAGAMQ